MERPALLRSDPAEAEPLVARVGRRGLRSIYAASSAPATVRCAIYTRKSTDEGLERDFNSLDNQRERAEAFRIGNRIDAMTRLFTKLTGEH